MANQLKIFLLLFLTLLSGCQRYDALVDANEDCVAAWGDVQATYQRRWDLTPMIVSAAKAGAESEKTILLGVAEARASATRVNVNDPASLAEYQAVQDKSFQSTRTMIMEANPEIRSTEAFLTLMAQFEGTENRILLARKEYNAAVKRYNSALRKVRGKAVNSVTGHPFEERAYFESDPVAAAAPKVEF